MSCNPILPCSYIAGFCSPPLLCQETGGLVKACAPTTLNCIPDIPDFPPFPELPPIGGGDSEGGSAGLPWLPFSFPDIDVQKLLAVGVLGFIGMSMFQDNIKGAVAGAVVPGVLGVFIPAPEEAVSVPAGAVIGGLLGWKQIKKFLTRW